MWGMVSTTCRVFFFIKVLRLVKAHMGTEKGFCVLQGLPQKEKEICTHKPFGEWGHVYFNEISAC